MSNTQDKFQKIVEEEIKLFNPSNSAKRTIKKAIDEIVNLYGDEDWYHDDLNASTHFPKDLAEQIYDIFKPRVKLLKKLNLGSNYRTFEVLKSLEQQDRDNLFIYDTKTRILELVQHLVKQKHDLITRNTIKLRKDRSCTNAQSTPPAEVLRSHPELSWNELRSLMPSGSMVGAGAKGPNGEEKGPLFIIDPKRINNSTIHYTGSRSLPQVQKFLAHVNLLKVDTSLLNLASDKPDYSIKAIALSLYFAQESKSIKSNKSVLEVIRAYTEQYKNVNVESIKTLWCRINKNHIKNQEAYKPTKTDKPYLEEAIIILKEKGYTGAIKLAQAKIEEVRNLE